MGNARGARKAVRFALPLACAFVAIAPTPGAIATLTVEVVQPQGAAGKGVLKITGDETANSVDVRYENQTYKVSQSSTGQVAAGNGCVQAKDQNGVLLTRIECTGDRDRVYVNLLDGDNFFTISAAPNNMPLTVEYAGGKNVDTVQGNPFSLEKVDGGAGDDKINTEGNFGNADLSERLLGGPGNDVLLGQEGNDLIDGGPDSDLMYGDGQFGEDADKDGVDHIDAADNPRTTDKNPIDCGGQQDTFMADDFDGPSFIRIVNCETEKKVTVQLDGAGDPAAGANTFTPKPEDPVEAKVKAEDKTNAEIKGKLKIPPPKTLGDDPKLAPFAIGPLAGLSAKKKKSTVIPIRARTLKLQAGAERVLELDLSAKSEGKIRRSLERGGAPTLTVTVEAGGKKKGKKRTGGATRDTDTIAFGL